MAKTIAVDPCKPPRAGWYEINGRPVKVWTRAQERAFASGLSWKEVDAMEKSEQVR